MLSLLSLCSCNMLSSLLDYYNWEQCRLIAEAIKRKLFSPAMSYLDNFAVSDIPLLLHQDDSDVLMRQQRFQDMSNNQLLYQLRMAGTHPSLFLTHEALLMQLEAAYNGDGERPSPPHVTHPPAALTSHKRSYYDIAEEHIREQALTSPSKKQCRTKSFDSGYTSQGAYTELDGINFNESSCNEKISLPECDSNRDICHKTQGPHLDRVHVWQHPSGGWMRY